MLIRKQRSSNLLKDNMEPSPLALGPALLIQPTRGTFKDMQIRGNTGLRASGCERPHFMKTRGADPGVREIDLTKLAL